MPPKYALRLSNKKSKPLTVFNGLTDCFDLGSCPYDELSNTLSASYAYRVEFMQQPRSDLRAIEEDLFIGPVAVLKKSENSGMCWGVFAKQDFICHGERLLGQYLGEVKQSNKPKKQDTAFDYTFDFNDGTCIDAKYKRGWPAMVNSASCYESANVIAKKSGHAVYYYLLRTIKAGEQLLVYYGDDYRCQNKRFLNPTDNWQESSQKFNQHAAIYTVHESQDRDFLSLFDFPQAKFAIPDPIKSETYVSIDMPILAYKNTTKLLPQHQQENITRLMLACWAGHFDYAKHLLTLGANPNQQTSIRGYSCLHMVLNSPHLNAQQKIAMIDCVLDAAGTALKLQDWHDDTILHLAIKTKQVEVAASILKRDAGASRYGEHKSIRDCLNEDKMDIFELALISMYRPMIQCVLPYWRPSDIDCLLGSRTEIKQAFKKLGSMHSHKQIAEYMNHIVTQINDASLTSEHKESLSSLLASCIPVEHKSNADKSTGKRSLNGAFFKDTTCESKRDKKIKTNQTRVR